MNQYRCQKIIFFTFLFSNSLRAGNRRAVPRPRCGGPCAQLPGPTRSALQHGQSAGGRE